MPDDLLNAIIDALLDPPNDPGRGLADYSPDRASESTLARAVLAVLGDPVRRLALLELVGDVREGVVYDEWEDEGYWSISIRAADGMTAGPDVFVVRPRGGAADG